MDLPSLPMLFAALLLLNGWTFMLFGFDKLRAEAGSWRIAESTLLGFAFAGGSPGAFLGRKFFRHKTRKQPFSTELHRIAMAQAFCAVVAVFYHLM